MTEIEEALWEAWKRVGPMLAENPPELARRVGRRSSTTLRDPVRAWCMTVRANDSRIERSGLQHEWGPEGSRRKHKVTLNSAALGRLCAPVRIDWPGQTIDEVAAKLGVPRRSLDLARVRGVLRTHYVPAARGKRQPLLYADEALDPGGGCLRRADAMWGATRNIWDWRIPGGIDVTLERLPCFYNANSRYVEDEDCVTFQARATLQQPRVRLPRLPAAPPDAVWYKWKGNEYLGYDWRMPGERERYEREQRRRANSRAAYKARRQRRAVASQGRGGLRFRGWRWVCPVCAEAVVKLYYPLPEVNVLEHAAAELIKQFEPRPMHRHAGFACKRCHRLRDISRSYRQFWNQLVTRLSGGLLYGREVSKPAAMSKFVRKRRCGRRRHRDAERNEPRRRRVRELYEAGWTYRQMADRLGCSVDRIHYDLSILRKRGEISGDHRSRNHFTARQTTAERART